MPRKLNWEQAPGCNCPHAHLNNQRVLRIRNTGDHNDYHNDYQLELLTTKWEILRELTVKYSDQASAIESLKDYAEYLFIGSGGGDG